MLIKYPKNFIKEVLIDEIRDVVLRHPYLSFLLMCSGIEFLGKCIDVEEKDWNRSGKSAEQFQCAIIKLFSTKYHPFAYLIYSQLRCGIAHSYAPKSRIAVSERINYKGIDTGKCIHLKKNTNDQIVFVAEDFYDDFVKACNVVINKNFSNDKMMKPFLGVPE